MDTENPTETKALQVPEPPPIRPEEPTGEGDVGERVATLGHSFASESMMHHYLSLIIIDPAGMVPLVVLRRTKKPESARGGTCRDHAINGPRSWTTQS